MSVLPQRSVTLGLLAVFLKNRILLSGSNLCAGTYLSALRRAPVTSRGMFCEENYDPLRPLASAQGEHVLNEIEIIVSAFS